MAESPSAALPGGVEWLPALGGARLLRAEAGPGAPPALILSVAGGAEHRIEPGPEARFNRHLEYLVPGELAWDRASLAWPDGTRVPLPVPAGRRAAGDIIDLRSRRTPPEAVRGRPIDGPALGWAAAPAPAPAPRRDPPRLIPAGLAAGEPWTAPPVVSGVQGAAEAEWHARRADLERELARAAEALSRARAGERAARDSVLATLESVRAELRAARAARAADASALVTLAGELDAERSAHAVTRGTAMTLAETLAAARAEAASARADLEAERSARARELALLPIPAGPRDEAELQRRAREQAVAASAATRRPSEQTGRLLADLAAAAASLRATIPEPDTAAGHAVPAGDAAPPPPAVAARGGGWAPPEPVQPAVIGSPAAGWSAGSRRPALATPFDPRRLRRGLAALAREDGVSAAALIAGLLPAQGRLVAGDISYDLTIRGLGTFAVDVLNGAAQVRPLARRRPRGEAQFHLTGDPLALAELLAGERRRVRRFRGVLRLSGRRRALKALSPLAAARLSLAGAVRAGAHVEPALAFRALPHMVDPAWTRGHVFTVAQEIVELAPRAWYITARDGVPLTVAEHTAGLAADATVTMTRATFDRLLRGDPAVELPVIRGDGAAVEALRRWIDMARGAASATH